MHIVLEARRLGIVKMLADVAQKIRGHAEVHDGKAGQLVGGRVGRCARLTELAQVEHESNDEQLGLELGVREFGMCKGMLTYEKFDEWAHESPDLIHRSFE